ncbi:molybdopterin oxidoreductase family protein [Cesiribacter sp. SM1]|uniref:molybdopterin oxidoreductase family protein n=1 Tax=Cesiribacter sp. SM1 TaxID=2861196 RepID=UPI001CD1F696|nr:nitrate reductase [Cesiribacter sp. SM1]
MKNEETDSFEGLSRRDFLRLASLGSGMVFLGGCGDIRELWQRQPVIAVDSWHKGVCRFCGTGCGMQIGLHEGKVVDVRGDKYAHNRGRLCIKGVMNRDILYAPDRALYPMIRNNGKLVTASWDDAMSLVAERFKDAIETYGSDSVGYFGSGQLFTEESYTASKLFKAGIRTNNVDGNPRLCMASPAYAYTGIFGLDEPMGCYDDMDHANCFLITGSNTAECHPILWERIQDRIRSRPETPIIVVDPRHTRTARDADLHLQIIPGTDVALYNSLMYEVVRRGAADEEMLAKFVTFKQGDENKDFEAFREHLSNYSPEKVAAVCGISAESIREAAYLFISSGATMTIWTMGLNQQVQGVASNQLIIALHLLTGNIGRPGATCFSLTGQPNAGGGVRDTGALSHSLPNGRKILVPEHRREMEKLWNVPEGTIKPTPGYHAVEMFKAMESGELKCALIMATNPGQSMPNTTRYRAAMEKAFLVVADAFHPTNTTIFADVVLPTSMWAEKGGVFSNSERRYHHVPKLVEAPGEARSDLNILVDFADRLGLGHILPARTPEAVWEEWRNISQYSYYNFKGITYERMKKERGLLWPCPTEDHPGTCRRYVPGEDPMAKGNDRLDFYGRPDGRAIIFIHNQQGPPEPPTDDYPFILTTGRVLEHWHTDTITGRLEELERVPVDFVEVHPADAQRLNLRQDMPVMVRSNRGGDVFRVRIVEKTREGMLFTTFHSMKRIINHATTDAYDPISKQPAYKYCAVAIEPVSTTKPAADEVS